MKNRSYFMHARGQCKYWHECLYCLNTEQLGEIVYEEITDGLFSAEAGIKNQIFSQDQLNDLTRYLQDLLELVQEAQHGSD